MRPACRAWHQHIRTCTRSSSSRPTCAPAMRRSIRRCCSRRSRSSTSRARTSAGRMFLTSDPHGRELCLRPDLTIPVSRAYLQSPPAGEAAGFCYLGVGVSPSRGRGRRDSCRPASNPSAGRTRRRPTPKCSRSGSRRPTLYGLPTPRNPHRRRRPVCRLRRRARSRAGVEAPPGQGFQPEILAGARSRPAGADAAKRRAGIPGVLAALAGSDPKAAHHLVTDLLSIAGIEAVGGRSVGEIAERFLEQAALGAGTRLPRETRALIERFLSVRADPDEAAGELRALAADAQSRPRRRARFVRDPHRLSGRPRRRRAIAIDFATAFGRGFDYYTGFVFELHDARAKGPLSPGGRYDGLLTRLGAPEPIAAVGFAASIEELAACAGGAGTRHERAAHPRRAVEGPPAAERRSVFRPLRARTRQAARRTRLSRRHRRLRRTSRSPTFRRRKSPRSSGKARCISASPAKTWCAS